MVSEEVMSPKLPSFVMGMMQNRYKHSVGTQISTLQEWVTFLYCLPHYGVKTFKPRIQQFSLIQKNSNLTQKMHCYFPYFDQSSSP